jgi:hypothetical protein
VRLVRGGESRCSLRELGALQGDHDLLATTCCSREARSKGGWIGWSRQIWADAMRIREAEFRIMEVIVLKLRGTRSLGVVSRFERSTNVLYEQKRESNWLWDSTRIKPEGQIGSVELSIFVAPFYHCERELSYFRDLNRRRALDILILFINALFCIFVYWY